MAIHNTIEVIRPNNLMFICGFFAMVVGILIIIAVFCSKMNIAGVIVCFIFGLTLIVVGISCMVKHDDPPYARPTGKKQLEVTFIDDEIPVNFLDKYEVIEQRGEIFVLEEK